MIGCVVHAFDSVASTQEVLAGLAREGAPAGTVVTARHQTAGRGRRGRSWWDAPDDSLLLSVLLRPPGPPAHVPQLSLVAALAVTDALWAAVAVRGRIRWPNDVLVDGRKICGILPEAASADGRRVTHVILGVGINVNQTEFPAALGDRATSIRVLTGRRHELLPLRAAVLAALDRWYERWLAGGFAPLRDEWRRRASTIGERVRVPGGGEGVAVDVAEDGALLVDAGGAALARVVSGALDDAPGGEGERDAARH
jgi:BirA family transcriptional regulator, biotin operon repressor / biotin---[acetyl-CoA-carboxylase] ligase